MSTPVVINGPVLREVIARAIARQQAAERRAWRRRHLPARIRAWALAILIAAAVLWGCVACFAVAAAFDL